MLMQLYAYLIRSLIQFLYEKMRKRYKIMHSFSNAGEIGITMVKDVIESFLHVYVCLIFCNHIYEKT